jgi:hypothetical protein
VLLISYLLKHDVLIKISEGVRFAQRRMGHYEVIDFLAVLFGYAISGERTLEEFYEQLHPLQVRSLPCLIGTSCRVARHSPDF